METTIYHLGDIRWKRETFIAHINYATKSKDCRYVLGDRKYVENAGIKAMSKRKDARAGFGTVFALPNGLSFEEVKKACEDVKKIFVDIIGIDEKAILIVYHDSTGISGDKNKHLHIIGANLNSENKGLNPKPKDLKKLHEKLHEYIEEKLNYKIRKEDKPITHIGERMRKNVKLKMAYLEYVFSKDEYQKAYKQAKEETLLEVKIYEQQLEQVSNFRERISTLRGRAEELRRTYTESERTIAKERTEHSRIGETRERINRINKEFTNGIQQLTRGSEFFKRVYNEFWANNKHVSEFTNGIYIKLLEYNKHLSSRIRELSTKIPENRLALIKNGIKNANSYDFYIKWKIKHIEYSKKEINELIERIKNTIKNEEIRVEDKIKLHPTPPKSKQEDQVTDRIAKLIKEETLNPKPPSKLPKNNSDDGDWDWGYHP